MSGESRERDKPAKFASNIACVHHAKAHVCCLPLVWCDNCWSPSREYQMSEEIFDSVLVKAVEEIDCPGSKWRYLYNAPDASETGIGEELQEKYGYSAEAVRDQIQKIKAQSSDDLIPVALSGGLNAEAACAALQIRTTETDKDRALRLIASPVATERELGVELLFCYDGSGFENEVISKLYELSKIETESPVLANLCWAMSNLNAPEAVAHLKHLVNHEDSNVRYALTRCFFGTVESDGIWSLVDLSRDEEYEIRDWAVAGLRCTVENLLADLDWLKEVFLERLDDEDRITRLEALTALIKLNHKSERVLGVMKAELETDPVPPIAIDAAVSFASPLLKETLKSLRERTKSDDPYIPDIQKAMEACN